MKLKCVLDNLASVCFYFLYKCVFEGNWYRYKNKTKQQKNQLLLQGELERVHSEPEMNDHGQGVRLPPILKLFIVTKQK